MYALLKITALNDTSLISLSLPRSYDDTLDLHAK